MEMKRSILLAAVLFAGCSEGPPVSQPAPKPTTEAEFRQRREAKAAADGRFEACRAKLKKAQALRMLHDLDWQLPSEPRVVAGPTFFSVAIDAKEGFAETVNCFLVAGEQDKCVNFSVLDWKTGLQVGRFENCRFVMRRGQ
jgi:hypothetical protein